MLHAGVFVRDKKYRTESLQTCPEDRPLIVQFCANDPDTFLTAVTLAMEEIEVFSNEYPILSCTYNVLF